MREDGLLSKRTKLRSSKYLNNLIEQYHRGIKFRTRPMVFRDVLQMDDAAAWEVENWAVRVLTRAALAESDPSKPGKPSPHQNSKPSSTRRKSAK
jgi:hypothetical protein